MNKAPPWTVFQLNRIFAAARHESGEIEGIPAGRWWSGLLLALLDSAKPLRRVMQAPLSAYDRENGILRIAGKACTLHPHTFDALERLRDYPRDLLFPWTIDPDGAFRNLRHDLRELLHKAGMPTDGRNLFDRFKTTGSEARDTLDRLNLHLPFVPLAPRPRRAPRKNRSPGTPKQPATRSTPKPTIEPAPPGALTVMRFFDDTYRPIKMADKKQSTALLYRIDINILYRFAGREVLISELTDDLMQRFMGWYLGLGHSPATVNSKRSSLLAVWSLAHRKGKVDKPPLDVPKFKVPKRIPECWSQDEMVRILRAAAEMPGSVCGIPAGLYWPALILLIYDTGLRFTAAVSLTSERFDPQTGWIVAAWNTQKQHADQGFKLHAETVRAIVATRPQDRDILFPFHLADAKYEGCKGLRKILKAAGLPTTRRDMFHKFRRTHATYLADAAGESAAQRALGHSSIQVTRAYIDPRKLRRRVEAADLMDRPEWAPPPLASASPMAVSSEGPAPC